MSKRAPLAFSACVRAWVRACVRACVRARVCVCVCVRVCLCVCVSMSVYGNRVTQKANFHFMHLKKKNKKKREKKRGVLSLYL